jgi:hypothetical protein
MPPLQGRSERWINAWNGLFVVYSVSATVALAESYGHQTQSTPVENLTARNEVASVSLSAPVAPVAQSAEHSKAENMVQQGPPYPYLPAVSNHHGLTLMPQIPGGSQYAYQPTDPQADVSRVPSLMVCLCPGVSTASIFHILYLLS